MTKAQQKKFDDILGQYTCNDMDDYQRILGDLQRALRDKPDELVDYIGEITMWEKVELSFTVREFCEQLELTLDTDLTPPAKKIKPQIEFQKERNQLADKLNAFMSEYRKFTRRVSPKHWRSTGSHCTNLDKICTEIQEFTAITKEESELPYVKEALK